MIYLKVVNTSGSARPIQVHINGAPKIEPEGELVSLVGKSLEDTNSIQEPRKVVPRTETVSGLGAGFTREFPAYSVSVFGQAPNAIPALPCCVVLPQDGEVTYGSGTRDGEHNIDVNFYLSKSPGDIARIETARQQWLPYLLNALHSAVQVGEGGAGGVQKALPTGYEWALLPYAGESYDGITIHIRVWTSETVTLVP